MARQREPLTDETRREVRAFVLWLWEESPYDEWEDFIRAAGIKQTTAHAWRWSITKPPVPAGALLYKMIAASGVFDRLVSPGEAGLAVGKARALATEMEARALADRERHARDKRKTA